MFDIVYSWGILHHTEDIRGAINAVANGVAPGGLFCFALYRRTPLCWAWRLEKRFYTNAPRWLRRFLEATYKTGFRLGIAATGRSWRNYLDSYVGWRGMDWDTDVGDWLGGYPYESISEAKVDAIAVDLGFMPVKRFCRRPDMGLFGSGCDEYVFRRA